MSCTCELRIGLDGAATHGNQAWLAGSPEAACHQPGDLIGLHIKAHDMDQRAEADPRNAAAWHGHAANLRERIGQIQVGG